MIISYSDYLLVSAPPQLWLLSTPLEHIKTKHDKAPVLEPQFTAPPSPASLQDDNNNFPSNDNSSFIPVNQDPTSKFGHADWVNGVDDRIIKDENEDSEVDENAEVNELDNEDNSSSTSSGLAKWSSYLSKDNA